MFAPCPARCPGPGCSNEFPLVRPLPSADSAAPDASRALFADLLGTMGLSDFPPSYIAVVLFRFTARTLELSPKAHDGISRFLRARLVYVRGVFDHAGSEHHSRKRNTPYCLPHDTRSSAPRSMSFRGSIALPAYPLSTLRGLLADGSRMTRG